ncbi:MAG: ABC transporter permease [Actinobacteria bacterium]|nr:ABC transporter permease [Actinomycetota bacterium]
MSAHAIDAMPAVAGRDVRPGLGRLTKVELRKMVNTRSGFWLQLAVLALTVLVVVITLIAGHEDNMTFRKILGNALVPSGILLPVVGILLVSSEWSQRTALVSFALVPGRPRLIAAKVLAGIVLGLLATAFAAVVAAIGTAVAAPDIAHVWTFPIGLVGQDVIYVVTAMTIGVGFGAALLASAPAIVLYFGLPAALGALESINSIHGTVEWFSSGSFEWLTQGVLTGHEWAQVLVALVLWMVLPLAIGTWRIATRDLN